MAQLSQQLGCYASQILGSPGLAPPDGGCIQFALGQAQLRGKSGLPHAHLVEAVLKDMASPDSQAQAAIAPVVIPSGMDACSEVGALVVKLYEAGHLQQRTEGPLQQTGVLPQQSVQQTPVLLCKPAYVEHPYVNYPSQNCQVVPAAHRLACCGQP